MQFLNLIVCLYQDALDCDFPSSTLKHDYFYQQQTSLSYNNTQFYLLEPLILKSQTAWIVLLQYQLIKESSLVEPANLGKSATSNSVACRKDRRDVQGVALLSIDTKQLLHIAGRICNIVFSCNLQEDDLKGLNWRSLCCLLQARLTYYKLKYAIKYGDIGIFQQLIP